MKNELMTAIVNNDIDYIKNEDYECDELTISISISLKKFEISDILIDRFPGLIINLNMNDPNLNHIIMNYISDRRNESLSNLLNDREY